MDFNQQWNQRERIAELKYKYKEEDTVDAEFEIITDNKSLLESK